MRLIKKANLMACTMLTIVIFLSLVVFSPISQGIIINNSSTNLNSSSTKDFSITIHKLKNEDEIDPIKGEAEWTLNLYVNNQKKSYDFEGDELIIDKIFTWEGIILDGMKLVEIKMELRENDLGFWPDDHDIADISAYTDENYYENKYDNTEDFDNNRPVVFKRSYNLFSNKWIEEGENNDFLLEDFHSGQNWYVTSGNSDGSTAVDENDVTIWFNISYGNKPPYPPEKPLGQSIGWLGEIYAYSTKSYDPDGDQIQYGWDWDGDFVIDELTNFYDSWETITSLNIWSIARIYYVKVIAIDSKGLASQWSEPFKVEINGPTGKSGFEVEDWSLGHVYNIYFDHYETQQFIDVLRSGGNIVTAAATLISAIAAACGIPLDISISIAIVTAILRIGVEVLNLMDRGMGIYIRVWLIEVEGIGITGIGYIWSQSLGGIDGKAPKDNKAPLIPEITSNSQNNKIDEEITFSLFTSDENNDQLSYIVEWGDETYNCTDFVDSENSVSISHSWEMKGAYLLKVKAIDMYGFESDWSEPYKITIKDSSIRTFKAKLLIDKITNLFSIPFIYNIYSRICNKI